MILRERESLDHGLVDHELVDHELVDHGLVDHGLDHGLVVLDVLGVLDAFGVFGALGVGTLPFFFFGNGIILKNM